ncbi:phage head morphogenesis protein [Shimazuella sp. AN120528]|uniref:phage head morphogenesis protein n=1 Tax=Shimazuella soli TaxID=1892854 RepID=UPI001F0EB1F8|nr:phage minor head protein [Shimazuella soli]MCH5586308.1 phage head morphogenesis protein [Shimazuella soli]
MKRKAERMLEEVTTFLCNCGELPAFKGVDEAALVAEQKLEKELLRLFVGVENRLLSRLVYLGYIPQDKERRKVFVEEFLKQLYDEVPAVIVNNAMSSAKRGRFLAFDDLEENGVNLSYQEFDSWTYDRLRKKFYTFSQDTTKRIIGDIEENLADSYQQGLGIDQAAERLKQEFDEIRDYRLRLIARTEINSAQNEGIQVTLEDLGVRYKQWLTAKDIRVRGYKPADKADHVKMHGEVVRLNERFSNGLLIPGDRTGNIAEWINCRCRIRPYLPQKSMIITHTPFHA